MKQNLGSLLALYPTPVTLVGAMVEGKPNWMQVAHVGIIGHDRILISCVKAHHTNKGIRQSGVVSVSLVDQAMLPRVDYVGSVSGSKADKSGVFPWYAGETGAPIPEEAPLTLECRVADNYEHGGFDSFVLEIVSTLVEADKLTPEGKPDYEKIAPVLFEFPTYSYLSTGKVIAKCLSLKEQG